MKKAKRILALLGVILLVVMYLMTLVFALIDHPLKASLLTASLFCTIVVPVLLYVFTMVSRWFSRDDAKDKADSGRDSQESRKS